MEYLSHNTAETEAIGEQLAASLLPGDVVAYHGGLGAGKTAFTRGLAKGLGYDGRVCALGTLYFSGDVRRAFFRSL